MPCFLTALYKCRTLNEYNIETGNVIILMTKYIHHGMYNNNHNNNQSIIVPIRSLVSC
jgi:hypothetical protein